MESKNIIKRTRVVAQTINPEQLPKNTDVVEECFFSLEKKHLIVKEIHICIIICVHKLMNVPYPSWPVCVVGIKGEAVEIRWMLSTQFEHSSPVPQALNSLVTPLVIMSLPTYSCS